MKKIITMASAVLVLGAMSTSSANVISDFNDNTEQGWTLGPSEINFNLLPQATGGIDGSAYLRLYDTPSGGLFGGFSVGGSGGLARAPIEFNADLTSYSSIGWSSLLPDNAFDPVKLHISDYNMTTTWVYTPNSTLPANVWESWNVDLDGGAGWTRTDGSASFAEVLGNVGMLAFDLEVSSGTAAEAGIDNVALTAIPLPAAAWLFGSGLLGLVGMARRSAR